jgi:hypothetical protein
MLLKAVSTWMGLRKDGADEPQSSPQPAHRLTTVERTAIVEEDRAWHELVGEALGSPAQPPAPTGALASGAPPAHADDQSEWNQLVALAKAQEVAARAQRASSPPPGEEREWRELLARAKGRAKAAGSSKYTGAADNDWAAAIRKAKARAGGGNAA